MLPIDNKKQIKIKKAKKKKRVIQKTRTIFSEIKSKISKCKQTAGEKKFPCTITESYIYKLYLECGKVCQETKFPFLIDFVSGYHFNPFGLSIDRIDNKLGYVEGNVRLVLWIVNSIKNEWGEGLIYTILKKIISNMESRPEEQRPKEIIPDAIKIRKEYNNTGAILF